MWQSFLNSDTAKGIAESLEKAGDVITKSATSAVQSHSNRNQNPSPSTAMDSVDVPAATPTASLSPSLSLQPQELASKLKSGWGTLVQSTKQTLHKTQLVVEQEQLRLAARWNSDRPYRRDPALPLDVEALRDAEVVYVTDRLLTMSHPAMQSTVDGDITSHRKLAAIGQLLHKRHSGKFMVWNMSEVEYDISVLDNQVLAFSFPGSPSPPLGLLLKLLMSIESWLKADHQNVAALHCLTGKGRTSTVLAAFLCWIGEAGFANITAALEYIAKCKHLTLEDLIIPSQRRYASYFANMLDGVRPSQPPLMLKRIIMTTSPTFAKGPPRNDVDDEALLLGCAPYLQIFKAGQLVFTTAANVHANQAPDELPFCAVMDGPISFHVENVVQGDILVRCRHLTITGQRVSMFRAAFHTGYIPPNIFRLNKAQLDGACSDQRFPDDFHLDLIFEPCDAEMAAKHLSGKADAEKVVLNKDSSQNEAKDRRQRGTNMTATPDSKSVLEVAAAAVTTASQGAIVTASAYDSMLHRDSRFWDVISARRQEHATWTQEGDPLWGPTIGRRRDFSKQDHAETATKDEAKSEAKTNSLESFSIGSDSFSFESFIVTSKMNEVKPVDGPKVRDELMEALMALDDESGSPVKDMRKVVVAQEEIVFASVPEDSEGNGSLFQAENSDSAPPDVVSLVETVSGTTVNEAAALLHQTDLDLDTDVEAFLAGTGDGTNDDEDLELDNFDFDVDDDDDDDAIDDLEKFLAK
jgi:C2 domain of PTEN tumour-suppressor protein